MEHWDVRNIRGASYDLRMGTSRFVIFRANGQWERVPLGKLSTRVRHLGPGDYAVVSTEEKLRFDQSIAGVVGSKFHLVRQGVLPLTGINVDPGFGSKDPQPLHFLIANMGDQAMALEPGRTEIATLQFHLVEGRIDEADPESNRDDIDAQFFGEDPPAFALDLFRGLARLGALEAIEKRTSSIVERLSEGMQRLEGRVEGLHQGSQQIILFGVVLIAATIAGVTTSVLIQGGLVPAPGSIDLGLTAIAFVAVALFGLATAGFAFALVQLGHWLATRIAVNQPSTTESHGAQKGMRDEG